MQSPLTGVSVIDLSRALAGPHAAMMLGDLGADVIKIENPGGGDDSRGWGPPFADPIDPSASRESTYFLAANRNKRSIALNLRAADDRATFEDMVRRADVLIENFRTGVLERLGLGIDHLFQLNPRLVVLSITGFGHDGPEGGRAGYDQIAQGETGLMSLTGPDPENVQRVGTPIADLLAGMYGAFGALAALREAERTGRGSVVRTSLLAAVVGVHAFHATNWTVGGVVGQAQGNHHPSISPYGLFRCGEGAVQVAVGSEKLWRSFCERLGLDPDDSRFATNADRVANRAALVALIEASLSDHTADEALRLLDTAGIPSGIVRSIDDVYRWDQTLSQGLLVDVEHSTLGPIKLPGTPLRFFDVDGEELETSYSAPPTLDGDREELLAELTT
ncbi:MAG TPA: CoA transferase [Microbacterium sp.]|uniref:CaiB/BaiF CoA transferase family protein n=1 Tax=Microbacterium sp. TaxID=51671 RepID=UPI002CB30D39|nr:CoA transferase [Microbacterium sp.]HWI31475.1 CoA transferase [Microbacterium sp.]